MTDDPRGPVLELLRAQGWNATSFQVLEAGFHYWWLDTEAVVAYVDTGRAWVAAGAPIAPTARLAEVAEGFVLAARSHHRRACFFGTEGRFAPGGTLTAMPVGEQPVWDPTTWEATLRGARSLREQVRRARARGVTVRLVQPAEIAAAGSPARLAVEALMARWLAGRSMAPMGFLVDVQLFGFPAERRYYLAEREGRVVGFLSAIPVYTRGGWFFEDLLRDATAPNGTTEALVDAAMRRAASEGSTYATMGLAPLSGPVHRWLRAVRDRAAPLYDFRGVHAFKSRLRPGSWDAVYLVHPTDVPGSVALYDVLVAFARGSFARFGIETLLRGPAVVVRLLALLLVPWTVALALAPTAWFPSPWVRVGWVLFDTSLAAAIYSLSARWRPWLATAIAAAVTADAAVTLAEALVWNLRHLRGPTDYAVIAVACAAPALAAAVLWGAVSRRARIDLRP